MKKQILFLALFVLAVFAGNTNAFGQIRPIATVPTAIPVCLTPQPFASGVCNADALHPVQGTPYTYTVTTTTATDIVRWFVVNDNDLAAGDSLISSLIGILPTTNANIDPTNGTGDYILSIGGGTYNSGVANNASIELSWKYFDGMQPNEVLLVAYVEGGDGCTDNIAVYRIIPKPAFTIDIASFDQLGTSVAGPTAAALSECVSPILSALYTSANNTTPNGTLTVDYGENWVYFLVNGANYIDSWMPQFQIDYTGGAVPTLSASWAYSGDALATTAANWNTLTSGANWTSAAPVIAGASAASAGTASAGAVPAAGGECIVVRVRLDWGTTIEHDQTDGTLTFKADGIAFDGVGTNVATWYSDAAFGDLHHVDCAVDGFTNDVVTYTITHRPEVDVVTPVQETKTGEGVN